MSRRADDGQGVEKTKQEKPLFLTPDDVTFLEACGISWGKGMYSAAKMRAEGIWVLVGTIEAHEC